MKLKTFTFSGFKLFKSANCRGDIVDELQQLALAPFDDWYRGSRLEIDGRPLVLQHVTCAGIDIFNPLTHFGSIEASNVGWQRSFAGIFGFTPDCSNTPHLFTNDTINRQPRDGYNYGCCYTVFLRITNPVLLNDPGGNHNIDTWVSLLEEGKYLTQGEYKRLIKDEHLDSQALATFLFSKSFDGIVYTNNFENPGSVSVVPLHSLQIRPACGQGNVPFLRYTHELTGPVSRAVGLRYTPTPSIF